MVRATPLASVNQARGRRAATAVINFRNQITGHSAPRKPASHPRQIARTYERGSLRIASKTGRRKKFSSIWRLEKKVLPIVQVNCQAPLIPHGPPHRIWPNKGCLKENSASTASE